MLRVMAYTKNLTDLSYHPNLSYFFFNLKDVSHTPPRIILPSPSTATPLNYTS